MRNDTKYDNTVWVDLESPTDEELKQLADDFDIHPLTLDELRAPSERAKVDPYKNYLYTILHFPNYHHERDKKDNREIDFIIGKKFFVTCHYQKAPILEELKNRDILADLRGETKNVPHAGFVFFYFLKYIYNSYEGVLEEIGKDLGEIEEQIFSGHEKEMVEYLSVVNHDTLDLKRSMKTHQPILASLEVAGSEFFGQPFTYYLQALTGEHLKVWNMIEDNKETLRDLRETNDSLLSTKTNEVMKVLTILAFITFPLSLVAGIFGMNAVHIPLVGLAYDFYIIVALMIAASLGMILYFRHKRWF